MNREPRTRAEPVGRRVRGLAGGRIVVDSERAELWFTAGTTPFWAFPLDDIDPEIRAAATGLRGAGPARASLPWEAADAWFEEDEQVFVHPRDPYRRVDTFASGRRVRWEAGGVVIAESSRAVLVAETGMPGRWYLPALDVRQELLRPSDRVTGCPYKGEASYWTVSAGGVTCQDAVWSYQRPLPEAARLAGLMSADPEQITIIVDGLARPAEPFHPRWVNPSLWL